MSFSLSKTILIDLHGLIIQQKLYGSTFWDTFFKNVWSNEHSKYSVFSEVFLNVLI